MEVRAKKSLGQHFLTDQGVARSIVDALTAPAGDVLEVGPGMGVLTRYLLERPDVDLRLVEIDGESVDYLLTHFPGMQGRLIQADFLRLPLEKFFGDKFLIIGNFPYNISSQIFFKVLDYKDKVPEVVCMIQKEVAERIAEKPGSKTYGILSVLLQAWYDIEYLFTVGSGAFAPPPKVQSAVIRLRRNSRTDLGCDEALFKAVVKTAFGQRRKTLRNSLRPLIAAAGAGFSGSRTASADGTATASATGPAGSTVAHSAGAPDSQVRAAGVDTSAPVFDLRPERLSVEDFVALTLALTPRR